LALGLRAGGYHLRCHADQGSDPMNLSSWRRWAQRAFTAHFGSPRRHPRSSFRPRLEALEDRVVPATTRVWDGGSVVNHKWTTAKNWEGNVAPVPGDELVFPTGVGLGNRNSTNDFPAGTTFHSISFTGGAYQIDGNAITLGAGGIMYDFQDGLGFNAFSG